MAARAVSDLFEAAGNKFKEVYDKYEALYSEDGVIQEVSREIMQLKADVDASNRLYDQSPIGSAIQREKRNIFIFRFNEIRQKIEPAKDLLRDVTRKIALFSEAVLCPKDRERLQVLDPDKVREIDLLFRNATTVLPQMREYRERLALSVKLLQGDLNLIKDHGLRTICQRLDSGGAPLTGLKYVGSRVARYIGDEFQLPALKAEDIEAAQKVQGEVRPAKAAAQDQAAAAAAGGMGGKKKRRAGKR